MEEQAADHTKIRHRHKSNQIGMEMERLLGYTARHDDFIAPTTQLAGDVGQNPRTPHPSRAACRNSGSFARRSNRPWPADSAAHAHGSQAGRVGRARAAHGSTAADPRSDVAG